MCLKEENACTEPKTISMGNGQQVIKVCKGCFARWGQEDYDLTRETALVSDMPSDIGDATGQPRGWRFDLEEPVFK